MIAALPMVTVLALIWLYVENQPMEKIANQARYTFWYVLPTLQTFLIFPYLLPRFGFWLTLEVSLMITGVIFYAYALVMAKFGISLL